MESITIKAEAAVLGSVLMLPNKSLEVLSIVSGIIDEQCFAGRIHQMIYAAMLALGARREPIDYTTLGSHLETTGMLRDVGGVTYLAELTDMVDSYYNVRHYARIVRRAGVTRDVKNNIDRASQQIANGEAVKNVITSLGPSLANASVMIEERQKPVDAIMDVFNFLADDATGYMLLGYQNLVPFSPSPGEMVVIGAWPSVGKTALAVALAEEITGMGEPVLFISAEMSERAIYLRRIAALTGIDQRSFRTKGGLTESAWNKIANICQGLRTKDKSFYIIDGVADVMSIEAEIRCQHERHGIKAVFIDHLHLLRLGKGDNEERRLAEATKNFSLLTKELGIVTFLLAQLSKPEKTRGENPMPRNTDLRGSGAIEENADIVWLLHREERFSNKINQILNAQCTKNRNGSVGIAELGMCMPSGRITDHMGADDQRDYAQSYAAASHPED